MSDEDEAARAPRAHHRREARQARRRLRFLVTQARGKGLVRQLTPVGEATMIQTMAPLLRGIDPADAEARGYRTLAAIAEALGRPRTARAIRRHIFITPMAGETERVTVGKRTEMGGRMLAWATWLMGQPGASAPRGTP